MSRTRYNRATNEEQEAHARKIREGGQKTVYLVGNYELGKTAYDYAEYLKGKVTPEREPWEMSKDEYYEKRKSLAEGAKRADEKERLLITIHSLNDELRLSKKENKPRAIKRTERLLDGAEDKLKTIMEGGLHKDTAYRVRTELQVEHERIVKKAIKEDKIIPAEVLKDYPDLEAKGKVTPEKEEPKPTERPTREQNQSYVEDTI